MPESLQIQLKGIPWIHSLHNEINYHSTKLLVKDLITILLKQYTHGFSNKKIQTHKRTIIEKPPPRPKSIAPMIKGIIYKDL